MNTRHSTPEKKPPQFEDFLKPNPFIRPWMLPYLPSQPIVQDLTFVLIGVVMFVLFSIFLHWIGLNDIISAAIGLTGVGILIGEAEMRQMIAAARFSRAKKSASPNKPLK